jgi:hypothetical protein
LGPEAGSREPAKPLKTRDPLWAVSAPLTSKNDQRTRHRQPASLEDLQHRRVLRQNLGDELLQSGPSGEGEEVTHQSGPDACP